MCVVKCINKCHKTIWYFYTSHTANIESYPTSQGYIDNGRHKSSKGLSRQGPIDYIVTPAAPDIFLFSRFATFLIFLPLIQNLTQLFHDIIIITYYLFERQLS